VASLAGGLRIPREGVELLHFFSSRCDSVMGSENVRLHVSGQHIDAADLRNRCRRGVLQIGTIDAVIALAWLDFLAFRCILPGARASRSHNEDRTVPFGLNDDGTLRGPTTN
jgi:hypothetical protein